MEVNNLLYILLPYIPGYTCTHDTLYRNGEPVCSLNSLKHIKVSEKGITLYFDDAEPLRLECGEIK